MIGLNSVRSVHAPSRPGPTFRLMGRMSDEHDKMADWLWVLAFIPIKSTLSRMDEFSESILVDTVVRNVVKLLGLFRNGCINARRSWKRQWRGEEDTFWSVMKTDQFNS